MRAWARPARMGTALTLLVAACGGGRSDIDFGVPPKAAGGSIGSAGVSGSSQTGGIGGSNQGGIGGAPNGGFGGAGAEGGFGGGPAGAGGGPAGAGGGPAGAGGGPAGSGGVGGSDECLNQATTDCQVCICEICGDERRACIDNGGCTAIRRCVIDSGCSGAQCYFGPCRQVIDDNGGPGGVSISLLQQFGSCVGNAGCPCDGGGGGNGGNSGSGFGGNGGNSGSGFGGNGFGGNGGGPGGCISCIAQSCPDAQRCFADSACRSGLICVMTQCAGGVGAPTPQCVLGCFNGDAGVALQAFQSLQCVTSNCGNPCGGGFPGGGSGGGPGGG